MQSLFLVTLGPVQDFIASARRTRDLHFGSWFLSEISRAAAYEIGVQQKETLIFPAPENLKSLDPKQPFNVANRILASIEQEPKDLATHVREAVFRRLYEIRDEAYKDINHLPDKKLSNAYAQIDDLVELVWVALPLANEQQYHRVRSQLESLLAARKNTHAFVPVKWGEGVPKSSLDGHLESVIPETEYPQSDANAARRQDILEKLYRRYKVAGLGERLSGVDLLKRFGKTETDSEAHFPSTSHIAMLPFLKRMEQIDEPGTRKLRTAWIDYIKKLDPSIKEQLPTSYPYHPILAHYDGSLLLEGRLVDVLLIPSTDATNNEKFLQARAAQQDFYKALDEQFSRMRLSKTRPSPYYALLQADGDSMGNLIDAVAEQEDGHQKHRKLSQAISRFAENVRDIVVNKHDGALIYSGGDDVLAFLPLHTVLQCAIALKDQFQAALKGVADQVGRDAPTLSVGIAIVHQLESLREVRRLAHDAEYQAKQKSGKNALAITVSKRGGEDYRIVGKWGSIDDRLLELIGYCRKASIPAGMAYELRDLALRLSVPSTDPQYDALQHIIRIDTLRILLRKLTVPAGKLPKKVVDEIEAYLREQLALPPKDITGQQDAPQSTGEAPTTEGTKEVQSFRPPSIETFINELVIAQMLAEAMELAQV